MTRLPTILARDFRRNRIKRALDLLIIYGSLALLGAIVGWSLR